MVFSSANNQYIIESEMQPWDEKLYKDIAIKRSQFFRPVAALLDKLGVNPDAISYAGVLAMVGFVIVIGHSLTAALWLVVAMLICDQLDGAVARYQKTDSDRGKFVDVLADSTSFSIFMIGLMHVGLVGAAIGGLFIYLVVLARVLAAIRKNLNHSSDWYFYSGAGPFPSTFTYVLYGLFGLSVINRFNYMSAPTAIFSVVLGVIVVVDYLIIRYQSGK